MERRSRKMGEYLPSNRDSFSKSCIKTGLAMVGVDEIVKQVVFLACGDSNQYLLKRRLDQLARSPAVTILNLHRVGPDDGSSYRSLAPQLFEELLRFVSRHFTVITFSEIEVITARPKLILSFDDGYLDYMEFALPLLLKYGLRANQNIIPRCAETGLPPLNVMAQDFVGKAPAALVNALRVPGFVPPTDRRELGSRLSSFLKNRSYAEQQALADQLIPQFFAWNEFQPTPMMTPDECRQIAAIHELGGHSYTHASMEYESDAYLQEDVASCQRWFREQIGQEMTIYAFPNGSHRLGQVDIVRNAGVEHILLVGEQFDITGGRQPHHNRFTFNARSASETRFKAVGGLARIPK